MWPRGTPPDGYQDAVTSDIPLLLISNSRHVIIPQHAHVPDGLVNAECLDKLMLQFYAKAAAKNLNMDCLSEVRAPPFATELSELEAHR